MLNPIPNLPVLIGHHKRPFTKKRIVGELGIVGDEATQGAPKWPTLDKNQSLASLSLRGKKNRKKKKNRG